MGRHRLGSMRGRAGNGKLMSRLRLKGRAGQGIQQGRAGQGGAGQGVPQGRAGQGKMLTQGMDAG